MNTENRFSPSPAAWRNQATLRHPERSTYRCFLTDLAGFIDICRAGPDYAKRQDRKKTGLFRSNFFSLACSQYPQTGQSSVRRCYLKWNTFILLPHCSILIRIDYTTNQHLKRNRDIILLEQRNVKKNICLSAGYISLLSQLESCCGLSESRLPGREGTRRYWRYDRGEFSEPRCVRCVVH